MLKYKVRNITFACDEKTGKCRITGAGEDINMDNPIEAFNMFWGRAGNILLNEVRNAIEKNGFNRYLGVKNVKENTFETAERLAATKNLSENKTDLRMVQKKDRLSDSFR